MRLSTAAESYLPTKDVVDPQTDMYILYSLLSVGITVVLNLQVTSTQVNVHNSPFHLMSHSLSLKGRNDGALFGWGALLGA